MNLWLDDIRDPADYVPGEWLWVKTVEEAMDALRLHNVQEASLDHDLGACDACYRAAGLDPSAPDKAEQWLALSGYKQMPHCSHFGTGYDLVLWMAENGIWPAVKPTVHSANFVGRRAMQQTIDRYFPEAEGNGENTQAED